MAAACTWDSIDVHLLRVLHAVLSECSVSKAAKKLNQSQPAISTALRRLREITGDPLLVRSRNGMTPTERGVALLEPVKLALAQIEAIAVRQIRFDPAQTRRVFNIAAPDYINASFLGAIVARMRSEAPHSQIVFHSLGAEQDYADELESGALDAVIGNWPQAPEHLRITSLFDDEVVCLMRENHPLAGRRISVEEYLDAEHLVPAPYGAGRRSLIDSHLAGEKMRRNVVAQVPHFNLVPYMLQQTDLLFTGPRTFASQFAKLLPLALSELPIAFPRMRFYLLWHDRTHLADECRWFREQIVTLARAPARSAVRVAA